MSGEAAASVSAARESDSRSYVELDAARGALSPRREVGRADGTVSKEEAEAQDEDVVIELKNVHKTYLIGADGVPALRGVDFRVQRGEFVAVYGMSGCGKSTLLSILGTIDRHSKGDVTLLGRRITGRTKDSELADIRLNDIGFVFQAFNLLPTLSVFANVELPMLLSGRYTASERKRRVHYLLERVGMMHRVRNFPSQLSGGEQQRVTIARALVNAPRLLLLDEPTGDLDTKSTDIIMNMFLEIHERDDVSLVMVTHDIMLRNYASRVVQMQDGRIFSDTAVSREITRQNRASLRQHIEGSSAPHRGVRSTAGAFTGASRSSTATQDVACSQLDIADCRLTAVRRANDYHAAIRSDPAPE
ncbi:ABC transporter H family member 2 [Porphyridium purpureum]|uniref:Probable ATP-dependent transporter ycf16 n=1 Tax=Porphyridium purpureum TaxID=35688 RepID=A0A5J4Z6P7_PORPP|nr:ABC transporter H family member 2 [Porphyridium purpureum]|eukprot:POR7293..scf295_1